MFVDKNHSEEMSREFATQLKHQKVDMPRAKRDIFNEGLALDNFKRYIGSVSCAMSHRRTVRITSMML